MADTPFRLAPGPTAIAFSGGRTSGKMLHAILDAHDGALPADTHVIFNNTGKERVETLDFVRDCGDHWNVPIVWLEWCDHEDAALRFREVGHNSASRNGEPFAALVAKRGYLPNSVTRFCTQELKINTAQRWCRSIGWGRHVRYIGLRADEPERVRKIRLRCGTGKDAWDVAVPLFDAGVTKRDVMRFWSEQPFDLGLHQHEGNCDLCFLKHREKIRRIMYDRPDLAEWWIDQERSSGATFRAPDRPTYQQLFDTRRHQLEAFDMDALDLDCACTD